VDETIAASAQPGVRATVVRCLGSFFGLLVVFALVTQSVAAGQPEWLGTVILILVPLGVFTLVEMIDRAVRWVWAGEQRSH
jgi:hypothetical protein